jgi:hypothetical protein
VHEVRGPSACSRSVPGPWQLLQLPRDLSNYVGLDSAVSRSHQVRSDA